MTHQSAFPVAHAHISLHFFFVGGCKTACTAQNALHTLQRSTPPFPYTILLGEIFATFLAPQYFPLGEIPPPPRMDKSLSTYDPVWTCPHVLFVARKTMATLQKRFSETRPPVGQLFACFWSWKVGVGDVWMSLMWIRMRIITFYCTCNALSAGKSSPQDFLPLVIGGEFWCWSRKVT